MLLKNILEGFQKWNTIKFKKFFKFLTKFHKYEYGQKTSCGRNQTITGLVVHFLNRHVTTITYFFKSLLKIFYNRILFSDTTLILYNI